ncbi:MAG TPA: hypothetical protein DCQ88_03940 [Acidimicrobiaceae bacterium]|nr:hypothetical protein [Acidimicrobiaceae bacterium]
MVCYVKKHLRPLIFQLETNSIRELQSNS